MKRVIIPGLILGFVALLLPAAVFADVPSLQVAPLSYTGSLTKNVVDSGYVDVSNPTDETIEVTSTVEGFHQIDTRGDLSFYSSPRLSSGIKVGLSDFELGPRQAIRVVFSIDPTKLSQGGVYAVIFFQTKSPAQTSQNSFVVESAKVGTLLLLTNGGPGAHRGAIDGLTVPFLQFGNAISGNVTYKNADQSDFAVAFTPNLITTILPWGRATKMRSGLLLPGVSRIFSFNRPGNYFGLIPVTVTATHTGVYKTAWVLADTGAYRAGIPLALVVLVFLIILLKKAKPQPATNVPKLVLPDETPGPVPAEPPPASPANTEPMPKLPKAKTKVPVKNPVVKIKPAAKKSKPTPRKRKPKPRKDKPNPS